MAQPSVWLRCGARGDIIGLWASSREQINTDLNSLRRELEGTSSGVCSVFVFGISFPPPQMHVRCNSTNADFCVRLSEELLITAEVSSLIQLHAVTRPSAVETEHKPQLYAHLNNSNNTGRHRQTQLRLCLLNMLWFSAPLFLGSSWVRPVVPFSCSPSDALSYSVCPMLGTLYPSNGKISMMQPETNLLNLVRGRKKTHWC